MSIITACVIAYQSEEKIKALLESLKDQVDHIVVGIDQKTTDKTEEVALSFGAITFPFDLEDNFAGARQQSFDHAPEDTEWFLWIDTDDTLHSDVPIRQIADEAAKDVSMIWFPYVYHRDEYGNVTTIFDRERLIRKSAKPVWQSALHETCHAPGAQHRESRAWIEQPNRTEEGKSERNLRILHKMIEDPHDHRARLYLAHQYFAATDWPEACKWYETFLELRSPGDVIEEKWQAMIYLTKARRSMGDLDGSIRSAREALFMCPNYADAYFELSHTYLLKQDWKRSVHWHEEGLKRQQPDRVMIQNPLDYTFNPFATVHNAYYKLGHLEKAKEAVAKAVTLRPEDINLVNPLVHYQWVMERTDAVVSAIRIADHLLETNEPIKAQAILQNLPSGVQSEEINEARARVEARLAHLKDEIEYENFYFNEEEPGKADDRMSISFPRVDWTIQRLKAMGAKKVLEVGIGDGVPAFRYAQAGFQVVGIDVDPRRVKQANEAAVRMRLVEIVDAPEHTAAATPFHEHSQEKCWYVSFDVDLQENQEPELTCKKTEHAHKSWTSDCELCGPVVRLPVFNADSPIQFRYGTAENIPQVVKDLGPFDAVILQEILEHVADPVKVLDEADKIGKHVIVTTPDGGSSYQYFQNKAYPHTNHSGHVRALSMTDLEGLIVRRGRLVESHLLADTDFILAAEYVPNEHVVDRPPVVIFCGEGLEKWNPDQINRAGLGGSETAVIKLAEEMVSKGLRVMVYGPSEGAWNGVYFRHYSKWRPQNPVMATIAWRNPSLFDLPIQSQLKYLWMHDTDAPGITEERMAKVDGVMVLSDWHTKHLTEKYPFLEGKTIRVGNGIDPLRFVDTKVERIKDRFIYASSPDRGLETALKLFPKIREQLPSAELHILYGWNNFIAMGQPVDYKLHLEALARQPGVVWRGRVGQAQLAKEFQQASVMLYPKDPFCETFCIAALEAQAGGCVPVTRTNGALPETNARGILVPDEASDEAWCTSAVKATETKDSRRTFIRDWALTQTWSAVCDRLLTHMRAKMPKPEQEPVAVEA